MKFSGLLMLMGLGTGLAVGSFFAPEIKQEIKTFKPVVAQTPPAKRMVPAPLVRQEQNAATAAAPASAVAVADLSTLLREDDSYLRFRELAPYIDRLRPGDIPGIVGQVEAGHGPGRDNLLEVLAGRWIEIDPQAALSAAHKKTTRGVADRIYDAYYGTWANRDPSGAIAAIQQMPDGGERGSAISAILYQIAESNPARAEELFKSVHSSNLDGGNHYIYSQWAENDLDQATQALLQPSNFSKAGARSDAIWGITDHLLEKDPQAVADWIAQLPQGKIHDEAEKRMIDQWSRTDPPAAMKWLNSLPDNDIKHTGVQDVMFRWADQDPPSAVAYVAALPDGGLKPTMMETCVQYWARADGRAALGWAQALPASPDKNDTLFNVIKAWAGADPAAAATGLQSLPQVPSQAGVGSMAPSSPQSPFPSPDPTLEEDAYIHVARAWTQIDPSQTNAWLNQLPAGPCRNVAVATYCDQIVDTDPVRAVQMAESINNADNLNTELNDLFTKWVKTDPNAAAIAVRSSPLSDDRKKQILESVSK